MTHKNIIEEALKNGMDYKAYRDLIDGLLQEGKTTGENHSEAMIHYTEMNVQRMSKWDKRFTPSEDVLDAVKGLGSETWLLITEGWCGDAAHSVPVIAAIADQSENINLKLVLRDENLELMDQYLTNGGRSIPKLIRMDADTLEVLSTWGPRPEETQNLVMTAKAEGREYSDFVKDVQIWYARNRGQAIQEELLQSLTKHAL
jgi:hypothetical protein